MKEYRFKVVVARFPFANPSIVELVKTLFLEE